MQVRGVGGSGSLAESVTPSCADFRELLMGWFGRGAASQRCSVAEERNGFFPCSLPAPAVITPGRQETLKSEFPKLGSVEVGDADVRREVRDYSAPGLCKILG